MFVLITDEQIDEFTQWLNRHWLKNAKPAAHHSTDLRLNVAMRFATADGEIDVWLN